MISGNCFKNYSYLFVYLFFVLLVFFFLLLLLLLFLLAIGAVN